MKITSPTCLNFLQIMNVNMNTWRETQPPDKMKDGLTETWSSGTGSEHCTHLLLAWQSYPPGSWCWASQECRMAEEQPHILQSIRATLAELKIPTLSRSSTESTSSRLRCMWALFTKPKLLPNYRQPYVYDINFPNLHKQKLVLPQGSWLSVSCTWHSHCTK